MIPASRKHGFIRIQARAPWHGRRQFPVAGMAGLCLSLALAGAESSQATHPTSIQSEHAQSRWFTIHGRVTRQITGSPVRNARIELRRPGYGDVFKALTTRTDSHGRYSFRLPESRVAGILDQLTITAEAEGVSRREAPIPAPGNHFPTAVTVELVLRPSTLNGVLDIFSCCVLTLSIVTVMLPAFFLGAAIKVFVPSHQFLRFLGPDASQPAAYAAAVTSGMVLSLCSCNVVPLFVSIWRSGAGIGPAFAFLYAGPAINVLSLVFTCRVIGLGIGLWRAAAVAGIAVITGVAMARVFGRHKGNPHHDKVRAEALPFASSPGAVAVLFAILLALLVLGSIRISWPVRFGLTAPPLLLLVVLASRVLDRVQTRQWLRETVRLLVQVIPILIPAVLVMGLLAQWAPLDVTRSLAGKNSLGMNLGAATTGAFMYFPIMTEVAFVKTLLKIMDLSIGPAMALLLTAPGLSLPGMLIVRKDIGLKRLAIYVGTIVVLSTIAGMFFGSTWGAYLCSCKFQ